MHQAKKWGQMDRQSDYYVYMPPFGNFENGV